MRYLALLLVLGVISCGPANDDGSTFTPVEYSSVIGGDIEFFSANGASSIQVVSVDEESEENDEECPVVDMSLGAISYSFDGDASDILFLDDVELSRKSTPSVVPTVSGVDNRVFGVWSFPSKTASGSLVYRITAEILKKRLIFTNTCSQS